MRTRGRSLARDLDARPSNHRFDFLDRTFARQHDEVAAQFARELHARRAGDGHLRRGVNRKIRREPADQPADAHVLHDGGIHAGGDDGAQVFLGVGQFVLEDQRVERDVALHAAPMQELHQLRQIGVGEIVRPHPGVELVQAEVNRIRAVLDGGLGAIPIAGGREQLRRMADGRRAEGGTVLRSFESAGLNCQHISHRSSSSREHCRNKTSFRHS